MPLILHQLNIFLVVGGTAKSSCLKYEKDKSWEWKRLYTINTIYLGKVSKIILFLKITLCIISYLLHNKKMNELFCLLTYPKRLS